MANAVKSQEQLFREAQRQLAERDRVFFDLVNDPDNPMTNKDLEELIAKHPDRYGRYTGFIGKLAH